MFAEAVMAGLLVVVLFSLRHKFGLALLYIHIGTFQYLQTAIASFLYFEIYPGFSVSPGSAILFNASLFAILLIYIKEDAVEARKLIYGIVFANITLVLFFTLIGLHVAGQFDDQLTSVSLQYLNVSTRVLLTGTIALAVDVLMLIIVYEFFSKYFKSNFLKIYFTMAVILTVDSVIFIGGSFAGQEQFWTLLTSSITGKLIFALVFSFMLMVYLMYCGTLEHSQVKNGAEIRDIFSFLTYRQKFEILQKEFVRDPLTKLYNRGFLNENLPSELERAKLKGDTTALLMIDIDNFKAINDLFGHAEGDKVLIILAQVIDRTVRDSDFSCRYGGEEFSVILPSTNKDNAIELANRIRENLSSTFGSQKNISYQKVSITIGIAAFPEEAQNAEDLMALADKRLYIGKESGRDCVVSQGQ